MRMHDRLKRLETHASVTPRMPLAEIEAAADRFEADGASEVLPGYDRALHIAHIRAMPSWQQPVFATMQPADWML